MFDDQLLMSLSIDVGPPQDIGEAGGLTRRCVPLLGGTVSGALQGKVMPGGADWQTIAPDGQVEIDARYTLDIGGALVAVESKGLRQVVDGEVYFRTAVRFRTASGDLAWLNAVLAISTGSREADRVLLRVYRVP